MPEGHVIHHLANRLNDAFAGKTVDLASPQGSFSEVSRLAPDGSACFDRAEAWGKHLFLLFDAPQPESIIHIHLGLIGQLRIHDAAQPAEGVIRLTMSDAHTRAHLHGPQWCRLITDEDMDAAVAALGADPNRGEEPDNLEKLRRVRRSLARSRRSIGSLLMDQKLFAGVGNIYRAEVLFLNYIDPYTPGNQITEEQFSKIWEDLVRLMVLGEESGRIDTVAPEHTPEAMGREPRKDDHGGEVYVYRRAGQPCYVCGTEIASAVMENRNLFWCPGCQR